LGQGGEAVSNKRPEFSRIEMISIDFGFVKNLFHPTAIAPAEEMIQAPSRLEEVRGGYRGERA